MPDTQSEQQYLQNYDPSQYEHPSVTVDILIFTVSDRKLRLLLIRRNEYPYIGKWAIPGGFLRMDESADEAAARRIREEAGVEGIHLEQLYTFSAVDRDPRTRVISIAYLATVPHEKLQFRAGTGAEEASLFTIDGIDGDHKQSSSIPSGMAESLLPSDSDDRMITSGDLALTDSDGGMITGGNLALTGSDGGMKNGSNLALSGSDGGMISGGDLAFDHAEIIRTAVLRMRGKLDYTDLAFGFLEDPSSFTLTELRHIHEAILGHPLDIGNFRRTIKRDYEAAGRIEECGLEKGTVGRPAMLYRCRFRQ